MFVFFFNDTATTEIYTLSLHDALPIWRGSTVRTRRTRCRRRRPARHARAPRPRRLRDPKRREAEPRRPGRARRSRLGPRDRKSTRLNSSHDQISYAVFCLKKKKQYTRTDSNLVSECDTDNKALQPIPMHTHLANPESFSSLVGMSFDIRVLRIVVHITCR